jgi:hypothetical protein
MEKRINSETGINLFNLFEIIFLANDKFAIFLLIFKVISFQNLVNKYINKLIFFFIFASGEGFYICKICLMYIL